MLHAIIFSVLLTTSVIRSSATNLGYPSTFRFTKPSQYSFIIYDLNDGYEITPIVNGLYNHQGMLRFTMKDKLRYTKAGLGRFLLAEPTTDQFNIGYIIRYGPNYGRPLDMDKPFIHMTILDSCAANNDEADWGTAGCHPPIIQDAVSTSGFQYKYRTIAPCNTYSGVGCGYPPIYPEGHPLHNMKNQPSGDEPFKIDYNTMQWIYIEVEVKLPKVISTYETYPGNITMLVYTMDRKLQGVYTWVEPHSDLVDVAGVDIIMGNWRNISGATNETFFDIGLLDIHNVRMGPPQDFVPYSCYGKTYNDLGVCNRNGYCIKNDNCWCNQGYVGEECDSEVVEGAAGLVKVNFVVLILCFVILFVVM